MSLLQQFIIFLLSQKPGRSFLTVKNYKADIAQFIRWFEKTLSSSFDPLRVSSQTIESYKKTRGLSEKSIERHLSSLRGFFNFLKAQKIISFSPLEKIVVSAETEDPWMLKNFKSFIYEYKKSNLTIKNYIHDIKSFFVWLEKVALVKYAWNVADKNLLNKINFSVIEEYKQRLIEAQFSPLTINRKLSSLRSYVGWAKSQGFISENSEYSVNQSVKKFDISDSQKVRNNESPEFSELSGVPAYSPFPPKRLMQKSLKGVAFLFDNLFILPLAEILQAIEYSCWKVTGKKVFKKHIVFSQAGNRLQSVKKVSNVQKEFYAPLNISTRYLPAHKRIWHYIRHVRPNWYKRYHSYSLTHYFHFAILTVFSCAIGFGIYNSFFANTQKENAVLGTFASASPRILSFKGKLTDSSQNPIIKEAAIMFSLYNDAHAPVEAALWRENDSINPDLDGAFSILLGKKNPIPDAAFSQNSKLFLGITVGNSPELSPRQELATVPLAENAQTLQGLEPITNSSGVNNVILALDSSGNLSIAGAKAHTFQTIGGNLVLSGKILSLTTVQGSNSNIEIAPDGTGMIDFSKPIQNSTNNNNLMSAEGSVEFDDTVAILATTSAQSALFINQNSTGPLISASTSGIAKFIVENDGTGKFGGDLEINGGDLTSTATTFNLLNSTVTTINIGSQAATLNLGASNGNTAIASNLILSSLTSNGGILYTNGSGKILQASAGSSSDCLRGGTTPSFTSCPNSDILSQANGTAYIGNTTLDVLFGGTATSSAKFGFININSGTPTASISGDITLNSSGVIRTTGLQPLTIGGTTTGGIALSPGSSTPSLYVANGGNVGVGTTSPTAPFEVRGGGTGTTIAKFTDNNTTGCAIATDGSISCSSDIRLKKNFENIPYGLDTIMILEPIAFNWKSENDGTIKNLGFIAQEVEQIIPKLVTTDSNGYKQLNTIGLVPILTKALQEQQAQIASLSAIVKDINLTSTGDLYIEPQQFNNLTMRQSSAPFVLKTPIGDTINRIGAFAQVAVANLKAGYIKAEEIMVQSLILTSDSIIVNGQNLKDYIAGVIDELGITNNESGIISPVVSTDRLATNIISPLADDSNISVSFHDSQLIIHDSKNASGSAVAKIDNQGNASFSGQLQSDQLLTNQLTAADASISGVLKADKIIADNIEGLEKQDFSFLTSRLSSNYLDLASYSAALSYVPDLAAERAQFNQGLMVFGPTSLSDLSVTERLSIGETMFITENSIETLGMDLSLQSLRQGRLSIMGGLVSIDTEGNLSVSGNLTVNNAGGLNVLSINQAGDIIASGSGTFAKLNFNFVAPALAVSATEMLATSSAGIAYIAPYQSEVTINNGLVTDKSVIYITPVGTPSAQTPFLMRQVPDGTWLRQQNPNSNSSQTGSFTVGVESPTNHSIDFNWLIIN